MRIFIAATSLRPAYGGPAYSVSGLAAALSEAGAEVGLWDSDQSAEDTALFGDRRKVSPLRGKTPTEALNSFGDPDILHDNGIWLRHNHQLARLAVGREIPRVVSTRGMLEPWAVRHKAWKKRLAWILYQRGDLQRASCLHATAQREYENLKALGFNLPICMIPNGVDLPELSRLAMKKVGERQKTALFLGRIYPVKGLPMLIEAWRRIRPKGWILQIAGPDEGDHQRQLEHAVIAGGLEATISFLGPIEGDRKQATFLAADLLVLPSHSESYGMVIAEALAYGLPVLTTTAAPWPMLEKTGCGWSVDPTIDGITEGLSQVIVKDRHTLQAMGAAGRELVATNFAWRRIAKQFLTAYEEIIAAKQVHLARITV